MLREIHSPCRRTGLLFCAMVGGGRNLRSAEQRALDFYSPYCSFWAHVSRTIQPPKKRSSLKQPRPAVTDSEGARSDADDQQEQASQPDSSNDQDGNPGDIAVSDDGFRCALTEAVHGGFPAGGCLGFGVFVLGGGPNPAFDGLDEAGNAQLTTCYPRYGVLMVDNPDANKTATGSRRHAT